jgi:hypothetical protein
MANNEEVTIPVTLTRSEWCEVVNALGIRAKHLAEDAEMGEKMEPGECTCGAYDAYSPEELEDLDPEEIHCTCIKSWAEELQSAVAKLAKLCEANGVVY